MKKAGIAQKTDKQSSDTHFIIYRSLIHLHGRFELHVKAGLHPLHQSFPSVVRICQPARIATSAEPEQNIGGHVISVMGGQLAVRRHEWGCCPGQGRWSTKLKDRQVPVINHTSVTHAYAATPPSHLKWQTLSTLSKRPTFFPPRKRGSLASASSIALLILRRSDRRNTSPRASFK